MSHLLLFVCCFCFITLSNWPKRKSIDVFISFPLCFRLILWNMVNNSKPYDDDPIICAIFSSYGVVCFHFHPNFSYTRYSIICGILLLIYNMKNSWEIYCVILLWLQWCSQFIRFDVCSILAIFIRISVSFFFVVVNYCILIFSVFLYAFSVSSIPYFISTMNVIYCFQFQWADTFVFSYISCLSIKSIHI